VGNLRKKGGALLKILFSGLLLYLVFTRIPFSEVWKVLTAAKPAYLLLALLFFILSKIIAAYRLNLYFYQIGLPLAPESNLKLYLQGMFYNLFLPGGIGGDAYKGYILHRSFEASGKKLASVLLLDRVSGLFLLYCYSGLLLLWNPLPEISSFRAWILLLLLGSLGGYWAFHQRVFAYLRPVFWNSLGYSALVQLAQLISVFFILQALSISDNLLEYLLVFLASSIVAILPITIGGIGSRELVFFYGAQWLELQQDTSIGVSMTFFLITAFVSLFGLIFHFRKPPLLLHSPATS
jgi:uncharacterized membrane protein YbhN (UPF0104 family)